MRYLKQNTAITIVIGALVDWADGKTLLRDNGDWDPTDITCELIKGSSSSTLTLTKTGGSNDCNLTGKGQATLELTAGNTDTAGQLRISFANVVTGGFPSEVILPFTEDFMVLPANVYDSLIATDKALAQQETLDFIKNVLEGDAEVDTAPTPWQLVIKNKTTGGELIRKDLKEADGTGITSTTKIIGQQKEPV